jgi:hypothetical protein
MKTRGDTLGFVTTLCCDSSQLFFPAELRLIVATVAKGLSFSPEDEDFRGNSADGGWSLSHKFTIKGPRATDNLPSRAVVTRTVKCAILQHL